VVGREDTLHIEGANSLCVDRMEVQAAGGNPLKLAWKSPKPEMLEVTVPMKDAAPGPVTLEFFQFGLEKPDRLILTAYKEAASLERLTLSAGDSEALLRGTRLDEVARARLQGVTLTPSALSRIQDSDQLVMNADASTGSLEPGRTYSADVQLRDGRQVKVPVTVDPPRPQVTLLSKGSQEEASAGPSPVHLSSADDLPAGERLVFFLRSDTPVNFPRDQKVEVAAADGSFRTTLALADGSLMLEDAKTAMGVVEPLARFGSSAFGPVQLRAVSADGVTGDWLPLGTLVRLPGFKELRCPRSLVRPCTLTGTNLFLASAISLAPELNNATEVPPDFTGTQLTVPHPAGGVLYLKLRDDPATVQTFTMAVTPAAQTPSVAPPAPAQTAPPAKTEP